MGAACRTCGGVGYVGDRSEGRQVDGQIVGDQVFHVTGVCPDCNADGDVASYRSAPREVPKRRETYVDDDSKTFDPTESGASREAFFSGAEIARQDAADLAKMSQAREE